jgi:CheY-like chemotaxis protein
MLWSGAISGLLGRKARRPTAEERLVARPSNTIVLVVEDDAMQRLSAVSVVEDAGFEALEAADADESIEILESRNDIRIVFTDVDMPMSIDGLKLAAVIRDRWPPVRTIVTFGIFGREGNCTSLAIFVLREAI